MTRFNITLDEGVEMVIWSINNSHGGEILVPKIPSFRVVDLAEAIAPECEKKIIGIRPGEKTHEVMITPADSLTTYDLGKYYSIQPPDSTAPYKYKNYSSNPVPKNFNYCSFTNTDFLSVEDLKELINLSVSLVNLSFRNFLI